MSIDGGIVALPLPGGSLEDRSIGGDLILLEPAPDPSFPITYDLTVQSLELLSQDTLLVAFDREMVVSAALRSLDSYTITPDGSGRAVAIKDILVEGADTVSEVVLVFTKPTVGEVYTLALSSSILSADRHGIDPNNNTAKFETRLTKMDSQISHLPVMYSQDHRSTVRILLQALAREDDKIGGSRDDFLD